MRVACIIRSEADRKIMNEAITVLESYTIESEIKTIASETELENYAKQAYESGIRVVIAGTRGDANFTNTVASFFNIPTVGIPMRALSGDNDVKEIFTVLKTPNEHAVANVALDGGTNAGILAVQILGANNKDVQQKIVDFKENLKNKIVLANKEITKIQFDYKTN